MTLAQNRYCGSKHPHAPHDKASMVRPHDTYRCPGKPRRFGEP